MCGRQVEAMQQIHYIKMTWHVILKIFEETGNIAVIRIPGQTLRDVTQSLTHNLVANSQVSTLSYSCQHLLHHLWLPSSLSAPLLSILFSDLHLSWHLLHYPHHLIYLSSAEQGSQRVVCTLLLVSRSTIWRVSMELNRFKHWIPQNKF
jgi:hypothetical protein